MTDDTQTVTGDQPAADAPNEGTEAQTEAPGAQDTADTDWDALLDDSKPESEKPTPEPEAKSGELKALQAKVDRMEAAFSKKDADEGITTAVGQIKAGNEALKGMPDRAVKSYLYGLADEHPEILSAFGDRHQNPKAWAKAQEMIGKEMAKDFSDMPDADLTAGVQAAANAVRGVSNQAPAKQEYPDKVINAMTDAEFQQHKKERVAAGG